MLLSKTSILLLCVASITACTTSSSSSEVNSSGLSCVNSSDCMDGELCVEKSCQRVDCVTSADCDIENYCNSSYECVSGCKEDTDCYAGDSCNTDAKECESYGCRSTELDCEVGEFCNPMTSECYYDTRGHCKNYCAWDDLLYGASGGECVNFDSGSGSCMVDYNGNQTGCSGGALCYPNDPSDPNWYWSSIPGRCITFYKALYCDANSSQEQCPNGFNCTPLNYSDGTQTPPVCLGDCQFYSENGYIH